MNKLSKIIKWVIKIAGVIVTSPVTFLIASQVFSDIGSPGLQFLLQLTAVLLVEGVFLFNWISLETDKRAEPAVKFFRAASVILLYAGLWALAIQHGENVAGIVIRLSLGVAVFQSVYEAGVWQRVSAARKSDRDIYAVRSVRRAARKAAKSVALQQIDSQKQQDLLRLEAEHKAAVEGVRLYGKHLLEGARSDPQPSRKTMSDTAVSDTEKPGKSDSFVQGRETRKHQQQTSKEDAMQHTLTLLSDTPDMPKSDIAEAIGRSRDSVYRYLTELEENGRIEKANTGSGYRVMENHNGHKS